MQPIITPSLEIVELTHRDIPKIATLLSEWQTDQNFNRFLLEVPTNVTNNKHFIEQKLQGEHSMARIAIVSGQVAGIFFLHSFNESEKSLEASMRIAPVLQGQGIATRIKQAVVKEALNISNVKKVTSWHSALNKGSFFMNKKCGGTIIDFVPEQTFLPNIGVTTDDFRWEITNVDRKDRNIINLIDSIRCNEVLQGLKKHNFIP